MTASTPLRSYRDHLDRRGIQPVTIERTDKAPGGDIVLRSWCRPVASVGAGGMLHAPDGKFVGKVL